ncbi:PROTEIN CEREBLON [Salix koriyanagi]|uniref:Protein cereblon n=1 Tax=Salix koriyanagi TaxID=2511006 RepID=A0A9Q0VBE3_9ROSI|nr:PROTEIN CEREBLON [Salix koriyanagi]
MDDVIILEAERHRIQELEFEELQIEEEVGGRDATGAGSSDDFTFNPFLASLHTYLGEVEDTHHRLAFLDGGAVLNLPLFFLEGVVLFPEATLPLRVVQPNFISAVERALVQVESPYIVGVVRAYRDSDSDNRQLRFATVGTTAEFHKAPRAFWPHWVYRMYDSYCLAERAADMWKQVVGAPSMDGLVRKPDLLSFYIASKIPVSEETRQELLEIDGISYRLRWEIGLLESFDVVQCKTCKTVIAQRSDMVVMSTEGPLGAYVNSHGYVHEIMTLQKANGLALIGRAIVEYSWFPGYAWTIAECASCETQVGWLFTATKKKLKPQSFWGIRSSQVGDDTR